MAVDVRAILAAYLLLGLCYSLVSPIFETPDEAQHFFVVREIVEQHGLPVQRPGEPSRWLQEGSQPPLYYLVGALFSGWIDTSDWQAFSSRNPFAVQGDPLTPGNRNVYLHRAPEEFPWHGTVLAVHILRLLSLGLGAASVLLTYAIACLVFPDRKRMALAAAALHAFIPQFIFISAAVSNDSLATLTCAAVLWQSLRVARAASSRREDFLLGALVGLAALSKLSGAAFALVAVAGVLFSAANAVNPLRAKQGALIRVSVVAATATLVAGWWYLRNLLAYGDATGLNRMLAIVGTRNPAPDFWQLLDELEGLRLSFWGIFGWFSILMPAQFYWVFDGLAIAAVVGLVFQLAVKVRSQEPGPPRHDPAKRLVQAGGNEPAVVIASQRTLLATTLRRFTEEQSLRLSQRQPQGNFSPTVLGRALLHPLSLPILTAAIVFGGVARWGILTPGLQGRLLFPALPAIALLLSAGLDAWFELLKHRALLGLSQLVRFYPLVFLLTASVVPFVIIAPAYARPELTETGSASTLVRWTGAAQIELVGSDNPSVAVHPGEELPLVFRWLAPRPVSSDYSLFIKVFGENDELLASTDTYPGFGMFPTTSWPANRLIVDRYRLRVSPAAHGPVYGDVVVGFYDRATGQSLLPTNADGGRIVRPVVARARIVPANNEGAPPTHLLTANFGDEIGLRGYDFDASGLTLYWQALQKPSADYTVFVQALDRSGAVLAQADGRPRHGAYPTSVWEPKERVPDTHLLAWPPQTTRVAVGLYRLESGTRLPLAGQAGDSVFIDLKP